MGSVVQGNDRGHCGGAATLARYVLAATLARSADAGAAVGLVLLAVDPGRHLASGAQVGSALAVGLTAPHLLGPWLARRLDGARDGRWMLAVAFGAYGLAIAAAAVLLGSVPLLVVLGLVALAGACGPLLTGGLSSRLSGLVRDEAQSQRRAEGWDSVSYGIGGTAGPAGVAALAALAAPLTAMAALASAAITAAALTLTLPRSQPPRPASDDVPSVRAALRLMATYGPLRRVTVATGLTALSFGALGSVIAVVLATELTDQHGAGATLAAVFGLGNLTGSLLVTAFPPRGEPEALTVRFVALMAVALALCALAPNYALALAAFAFAGLCNAPFFTATLAARSRYSPPEARALVFVTLAGVKVAMASAGTAIAGAAIGLGARPLLAAGATLTLAGVATALIDRRRSGPPQPVPSAS